MPPKTSPKLPSLKNPLASYEGQGLTSRQPVKVNLYEAEKNCGIHFILSPEALQKPDSTEKPEPVVVRAHADSVISTTRNTALGIGKVRVCFVEHILCALALCGIEDMYIEVLGPELPMGNGSCDLWIDLIEKSKLVKTIPDAFRELSEPIVLSGDKRSLMAIPADDFSVTYLIEMDHPKIGRTWRSWSRKDDIREVANARTFGSLPEHMLLGFDKDVVSYTKDDFTMPLNSPDEPVRHKLLDMIGDLVLSGVNPLTIKANFISIKGGHAIDVKMAKKLSDLFKA